MSGAFQYVWIRLDDACLDVLSVLHFDCPYVQRFCPQKILEFVLESSSSVLYKEEYKDFNLESYLQVFFEISIHLIMYIVSACSGFTCVIYLGLFKFKKEAMSLYNSAKQEIDEFASHIEGVVDENTMNINKSSTSFSISYHCRKNNYPVLYLSIEYYTNRMFNDFIKNNMYTLENGEQIPMYVYEEMKWREYFPDLFRGYSSQDLFDMM